LTTIFITIIPFTMNKNKKTKPADPSLPVIHPFAAGIDAGDTLHSVAVPASLATPSVRSFGTMTCDLECISAWLLDCGIKTVAIESTGVYWKPLFNLLNRAGLEVYLVNAREVKNVSGRKTDESDAVWLQKLHSFGLLRSAFLPDDEQEALRSLVRYRHTLIEDCSRFKNRIQKSLELMNIKFHTLFADLFGKTSQGFIEAILAGERNPEAFLPLVKKGIKADPDKILQSLRGNWRSEHLFTLEQSYEMHKSYQQRITACDHEIEKHLLQYGASLNNGVIDNESASSSEKTAQKKKQRGAPSFDVRSYLQTIYGTDVMAIYGISDVGGLEILAETGADLSKWPTAKHFASWLNLSPNNKQSGGKIISSRLMNKKPNAASQAFRIAANTLQRSNHWLGDFFRRMKSRGGNKYAVVATANKLATIYYLMVQNKQAFTPMALEAYQQKQQQAKIDFYERKLGELKMMAAS